MNFYEMSLLLEFDAKDVLDLAERIFGHGRCGRDGREVRCWYSNRGITFTYDSNDRMIDVGFDFIDDPEEISADTLTTARRLQPGTMETIRKFKEFATELKKHGIGIKYRTRGRRIDLYKKVLQQAGMSGTELGPIQHASGWEWR